MVSTLQAERTTIHEERRAKQKAFNEWEKEQRAERRRRQDLERQKQQAEWDAQEAQRELEKPNPYLNETTLLEQTIDYCKGLLPKDEAAAQQKKDADLKTIDGTVLLVRKEDRDADMFFAATKKKNLKKKGGDKPKATAIKHTAETFKIFDELKLKAPMTTDDLGPLMEKLQADLAGYMEKVAAWETERRDKMKAAEEAAKEEEAAKAADA